MTLTTSRAWQIVQKDSRVVVSNILTGRSLSVESHIRTLLDFCKTAKAEKDIVTYLKQFIPSTSIDATISTLLRKRILVSDEDDIFTDTIPVRPTLWGCAHSVSSSTQIVILGAPFGLGNAEDIRCKNFPLHLRDFVHGYYSFRNQVDNLDRLNPIVVGPWFDFPNFKETLRSKSIADIGDVIFYCGETPEMFYTRLKNISKDIVHNGLIPICIGGDHSITYPIVATLNEINTPFVILHFDAHADMKNGVVMKLHELSGYKLVNHANVIKHIIGFENVEHIYQIGIREPFLYDNKKITRISVQDINSSKNTDILKEIETPVYITFDVDFFDPSLVPGTATVLPNGGDYNNTFRFLAQILKHKRILGMDIVEANPALDVQNKTTLLVNNLLMQIISQIK